jgi:uncharacterized membrane protein
LIVIGLWGLAGGQFGAIWQPVPTSTPARDILAYACAVVSLAAGLGLLWRPMAAPAARLLLAWLLLWLVAFKARTVFAAPGAVVSWESFGETVVIVAGAWALYALLADAWDRRQLGFATGEGGLRIARGLYGLAMIAFGLAHLAYVRQTAALVPAWLPAHTSWVWFTGAAYIAAGAAILTGMLARLAAALSALQMGLFTLMVWAPMLAAGARDAATSSEAVVSWTLAAAGLAVAETYRGRAWLALSRAG